MTLKPCPFCGSEELDIDFNAADKYFVYCIGCGASGRDERTIEKAKEVWNRRYEDGLTMCYDCRWFDDRYCRLHKITVSGRDYCSQRWPR